jgi:hypothetical protein
MLLGGLGVETCCDSTGLDVDVAEVGAPSPPPVGALLFDGPPVTCFESSSGLVFTSKDAWLEVTKAPVAVRGEIASTVSRPPLELLQVAFLVALRELRIFELHAAVVFHRELALVLVGPSGSGKSTTALAHLSAGCDYLGDDRVLFRDHAGTLEFLRYPAPLRATSKSLSAFPEVQPFAEKLDPFGKHVVDVARVFPGRARERFAGPTLLLFPEVGSSTALQEVSQQTALERLVLQSGSLVLERHADPRGHLALLRHLATQSPRFSLSMGPEWLTHPERSARALLDRLDEIVPG